MTLRGEVGRYVPRHGAARDGGRRGGQRSWAGSARRPGRAAAAAPPAATGPLAFRRRAPLGTAIAVAAALALPELGGVLTITLWGDFVPWLVAAYSVARHADRRRAAAGLAVLVAAFGIIWLRVPSVRSVANIPFNIVPLVVVVAVGRVLRRRQRSHAALSMEARRLAEDQASW